MNIFRVVCRNIFLLALLSGFLYGDSSNNPIVSTSCAPNPIVEGDISDSTLTCAISLSVAPNKSSLSLSIFTVDVSSVNGTDYIAPTQNIIFTTAEVSKTYIITIKADTLYEANEEFVIRVINNSTPSQQDFTLPSDYTAVITNDDAPDGLSISIAKTSIEEGNSGTTLMNFPITISAPTISDVNLSYRFNNNTTDINDTNMSNGSTYSLIIPAGTPAGTYAEALLGVIGDTVIETDETFTITLLSTSEGVIDTAKFTAIGTISNDDGGGGEVVIPSYNPGTVDVVDAYVVTASSPYYEQIIKTKIAGQTNLTLDAIYLGSDPGNYHPTLYTQASMPVLMYLYDPITGVQTKLYEQASPNTPLAAVIQTNSISGTTPYFTMPANAKKEAYILMKYLDYEALSLEDGAPNCLGHSSTGANAVPGMPSCVASDTQYLDAFHQEAFDRCKVQHGEPCKPSFHGHSGGGNTSYPGYDPIYDHEYGCYECTIGATPMIRSVDNFAIRPEQLELDSSNSHMPDLLRSGSEYNISIDAYNFGTTTNTPEYNQIKSNLDTNESLVLAADGSATTLDGTVNWTTTAFNITNGTSVYNAQHEVAGINFDDVGKVTIIVKDKNWAAIDNDDTPQTCDGNGTWICGDKNVTFIPHHFNFSDINITNNDGASSKFTYISDLNNSAPSTFGMSARIQTKVIAQNEINQTTRNFRSGSAYYENPVAVYSSIVHVPQGDANSTIIATALLGFGTLTDENGTKTVAWNENNLSKVLRFNFARDVNNSLNPFMVHASDVNLSADSNYTQLSIFGYDTTANILGEESGLGDGNATFVYGRTHAQRHRFQDANGTASINYEVFCNATDTNGVDCNKTLLPNGADSNSTDDPRWFRNTQHNAINDGVVGTVVQKGGTGIVTAGTPTMLNPSTTRLRYNGSRGYPYKTTMENNASSWLIYNKYNANDTTNEFEVEFEGQGNWAGKHETNTTTKSDGATKTNRRTMW